LLAKPWARYEIGFLQHAKFLALNANAICLWVEGKNYADTHATDGLLPTAVVKNFRFYSRKAVGLLMQSVGRKSELETYAPLWEAHEVGYKMHDYLEHNDCREIVLERQAQADEREEQRRLYDRDYKAKMREAKKAKRERVSTACPPPVHSVVHSPVHPVVHSLSSSITETETETKETRTKKPPLPDARSRRPIFSGQKLTVFEWMLDDLLKLLAPHGETFGLDEWFWELDTRCVERGEIPPERDGGAWLKSVTFTEAMRRGLPLRTVSTAKPSDDEMWAEIARKGPSVRS
jgi:hypothetical protein